MTTTVNGTTTGGATYQYDQDGHLQASTEGTTDVDGTLTEIRTTYNADGTPDSVTTTVNNTTTATTAYTYEAGVLGSSTTETFGDEPSSIKTNYNANGDPDSVTTTVNGTVTGGAIYPVSYTHLTLPTNREV